MNVKINADHIVDIVCAVLERSAELIEQKKPTGQSIKQSCEEMRDYARKNKGKAANNIKLP